MCDDRNNIIYYQIGWPGTVFDSTVFDKSAIAANPAHYFSPGEYAIADCGYAIKWWLCVPHRQPAADIPHNKIFNHVFSCGRCKIEHTNGLLKCRFPSLRGIRTQIKKKIDFKKVNTHVLVCLILHNLLKSWKDEWEIDEEDVDNDNEGVINHEAVPTDGHALRVRVQTKLLEWYFEKK